MADVWKELSRGQPRKEGFKKLWLGLRNDAVRSADPVNSKARPQATPLPAPAHKEGGSAKQQPPLFPSTDAAGCGGALEGAALERVVQQLLDRDVRTRRAALGRVQVGHAWPSGSRIAVPVMDDPSRMPGLHTLLGRAGGSGKRGAASCCTVCAGARMPRSICSGRRRTRRDDITTHLITSQAELERHEGSARAAAGGPPPPAAAPKAPLALFKPLLRRFDDASEQCRELAAGCLLRLLKAYPDEALGLLPYAVPVLEERMQRRVRRQTYARMGARGAACFHRFQTFGILQLPALRSRVRMHTNPHKACAASKPLPAQRRMPKLFLQGVS